MGTMIPMLDLMFFLTETHENPRHVGAVLVFKRPRRGGTRALREIVEAYRRARPVPPFNRVPVFRVNGLPEWREVDRFEARWHLQRRVLPAPGTDEQLYELVARLHSPMFERDRPGWRIYFIEGLRDDRFAIYVRVHHSLIDGESGIALVHQTLTRSPADRHVRVLLETQLPAAAAAAKPADATERLEREAHLLTQRALSVGQGATRLVEEALAGLRGYSAEESRPFTAPRTLLNAPIHARRAVAQARLPLPQMKSVAQAWGATVNDVALCMLDHAMHRYLREHDGAPNRPLTAVCPVSLHDKEAKRASTQVSVFWAPLGQPGAEIGERMRQVIESTQAAKQRIRSLPRDSAYAYSVMMFAFGEVVAALGQRESDYLLPANVLISNVRGPEEPLYLNGARLETMCPVSTLIAGMGLNITLMSYAGHVDIGFTGNASALPDLGRMARHAEEALVDLARAEVPARAGPVRGRGRVPPVGAVHDAPAPSKSRRRKKPPTRSRRRPSRAASRSPGG